MEVYLLYDNQKGLNGIYLELDDVYKRIFELYIEFNDTSRNGFDYSLLDNFISDSWKIMKIPVGKYEDVYIPGHEFNINSSSSSYQIDTIDRYSDLTKLVRELKLKELTDEY